MICIRRSHCDHCSCSAYFAAHLGPFAVLQVKPETLIFMHCSAMSSGKSGVNILVLCAGYVDTKMWKGSLILPSLNCLCHYCLSAGYS